MKTTLTTQPATITCGQCERYRPATHVASGVIPSYCRIKAEWERGVDIASTKADTPAEECRWFEQVG